MPIFHFTELARRTRVAGHENYGADWYVGLEEFLCGNDRANSVGVQVESKLLESTATILNKIRSFSKASVQKAYTSVALW